MHQVFHQINSRFKSTGLMIKKMKTALRSKKALLLLSTLFIYSLLFGQVDKSAVRYKPNYGHTRDLVKDTVKPIIYRDIRVATDLITVGAAGQTSPPVEPPKPTTEQLQRKGPSIAWTNEWKNLIGSAYDFPSEYPLVNIFHQI